MVAESRKGSPRRLEAWRSAATVWQSPTPHTKKRLQGCSLIVGRATLERSRRSGSALAILTVRFPDSPDGDSRGDPESPRQHYQVICSIRRWYEPFWICVGAPVRSSISRPPLPWPSPRPLRLGQDHASNSENPSR